MAEADSRHFEKSVLAKTWHQIISFWPNFMRAAEPRSNDISVNNATIFENL